MRDEQQLSNAALSRPSARPLGATSPIQRANYGIPPRQSTATPAARTIRSSQQAALTQQPTGRFMDIAIPVRPATTTATPSSLVDTAQTPQPASTQTTTSQPDIATTVTAKQPLLSTIQEMHAPQPIPAKFSGHRIISKIPVVLAFIAVLLVGGGGARLATAGSTASDTKAVGAVVSNDGHTMTVQFTANDGQLHKFTDKSNASLIPGSAIEVAYRPGAADTSAKQVVVVKHAQNLGTAILVSGVGLFVVNGGWLLVRALRSSRAA